MAFPDVALMPNMGQYSRITELVKNRISHNVTFHDEWQCPAIRGMRQESWRIQEFEGLIVSARSMGSPLEGFRRDFATDHLLPKTRLIAESGLVTWIADVLWCDAKYALPRACIV